MKIKLLFLLGIGFHGFAFAESGYEVLVTVKDAKSELVFPAFDVSKTNKSGTSQVGGCTYLGKLTEQDGASLLLEGQMSCVYEDGNSYMDMPIFVLSSKGDRASMELGDDETETWKYSVEVKVLP
ncbi:hypothetical protein [Pseudoalteromonas sp. 20-MNA-CIBAN-0454]|uniref:hypothetical protein n=1 Tax=Pseudoalteromonas sp. 20-MNA-CIBAN-0454 TaxID=3140424 RepID=UPI00333103B2|tara:strand:+ start:760 stop:1134 length:375 start_codon:yes stop_codon:yes gene_type:complete